MNVENKINKIVKILKEKGFVVYRKGGKEPGVFYAKEGDSRIGFVYPNNGYIYDRIKMWSFSRVYKPHKKTGSSCLMCVSDEFTIENAIKSIEDRLWVNYIKGIAYATKEKYDNEVCDKEGDWREDCVKIIDNEVKSIGMWMWGDVKGYVLEKKVAFTKKYKDESREDEDCEEWEEVDSCWGCYEETDELIKEVMIENGLEE